MKKTLSLILLMALFMPVLNDAYAQTDGNKKVLFYLKTEANPKKNANTTEEQSVSHEQSDEDAVYSVVEKMPEFPGGQAALFKYLSENVEYPLIAKENGIQGRVMCEFIVDKDGSITEVKVTRSVDPSLDREAVRVIKSMPKWNPGKQKGKPVRVKYTMPINFRAY